MSNSDRLKEILNADAQGPVFTSVDSSKDTDVSSSVEKPQYYKDAGVYEVRKVAEAWGFDKEAYLFSALKYLGRLGKKTADRRGDLKKSIEYLTWELENEERRVTGQLDLFENVSENQKTVTE